MRDFFFNLLTSGTLYQYDIGRRSRIIFMNTVMIVGVVVLLFFSTISFSHGETVLGISTAITGASLVAVFVITRIFKTFVLSRAFLVSIIFLLYGYLVFSGGSDKSGILWIMSYPLISLFLLGIGPGTVVTFAFWSMVAVFLLVPQFNAAGFSVSYTMRVLGTYIFIWMFALTYELVRSATQNRLEESNRSLAKITADLQGEKAQTDAIMKNVKEGIFLLGKELCFNPTYSEHLESILEKKSLSGISFPDLFQKTLNSKDLGSLRDYLEMFFTGTVNADLLHDINPISRTALKLEKADESTVLKHLAFVFSGIETSDGSHAIMGVVRDITEEVQLSDRLKEEEESNRRNMENLFQIIHVDPAMMQEFLSDAEAELDHINEILKREESDTQELLTECFRAMHAIKGNAALLGLMVLSRKLHLLENRIRELLEQKAAWSQILDLTMQLADVQGNLNEIRNLIDKIMEFQSRSIASEHHRGLMERALSRIISNEADRNGRKIIFNAVGFDSSKIPEYMRKTIKDALIQLARNSIYHGIELPSERERKNKNREGEITLSMVCEPDELRIHFRDDGNGLDTARIREKAILSPAMQLYHPATLDDSQLARLIFHPGFSTSDETSMMAGRGMGMHVIKAGVEKLGGSLKVRTARERYTEFVLILPMTGKKPG